MKPLPLRPFYAIVGVVTGHLWYKGKDLRLAAERLEPGCVWGMGSNVQEAIEAAEKAAERLRKGAAA